MVSVPNVGVCAVVHTSQRRDPERSSTRGRVSNGTSSVAPRALQSQQGRATLRQDLDDNATLYGKPLENREVVTMGVRAPAAAAKLIARLNRYSARERTE
jgi:hypothetical protein